MPSRQKAEHWGIAIAEYPNLVEDLGVAWINHVAAPQVAKPLRLEPEREVDAADVQIQRGVEELLLGGGHAERQPALEFPFDERQAEPVVGTELRVLRALRMRLGE